MALSRIGPPRPAPRISVLVLLFACAGLPLAGAGLPAHPDVVIATPAAVADPPGPAMNAGPPLVQASCGTNIDPFVLTATPTVVNGGQGYTLSWCNPAWTSGGFSFTPSYYYLYQNSAANPTHYDFIANYPASTLAVGFTTTTADIGKTFGYVMHAYGTQVGIGGTYDSMRESNTVAVQVVASGGGGGGGGGGGSWTPCTPTPTALCLHGNRFRVTANFVANGSAGQGQAVKLAGTDDSGYFWFFDPQNMEIVAKIASFCSGTSGQYGFYVSGLTDVQVLVTLTDMKTGAVWQKANPNGTNMCKDAAGGFSCP